MTRYIVGPDVDAVVTCSGASRIGDIEDRLTIPRPQEADPAEIGNVATSAPITGPECSVSAEFFAQVLHFECESTSRRAP